MNINRHDEAQQRIRFCLDCLEQAPSFAEGISWRTVLATSSGPRIGISVEELW